jgi:SAM-dependent methyltransferase
MSRDHRREYYRAWSRLTPPWRPHLEVIEAVKQQIGDQAGRTLLLGVTPELANILDDLVALDRNYSMVVHVWPGNTSARRAAVGDWRNGNFAPNSFSACVGDGSLCGLRSPDEVERVLTEISLALRSGGKFVCRVFAPPAEHETISAVAEAALSGVIGNFHGFKMRFAMALAAQRPEHRVGVSDILGEFDKRFGDRDELVRVTGWNREEIDTIDFYKGSTIVFNFPTRQRLLSVVSAIFPNARFVAAGTYELANCCPLLVAERN